METPLKAGEAPRVRSCVRLVLCQPLRVQAQLPATVAVAGAWGDPGVDPPLLPADPPFVSRPQRRQEDGYYSRLEAERRRQHEEAERRLLEPEEPGLGRPPLPRGYEPAGPPPPPQRTASYLQTQALSPDALYTAKFVAYNEEEDEDEEPAGQDRPSGRRARPASDGIFLSGPFRPPPPGASRTGPRAGPPPPPPSKPGPARPGHSRGRGKAGAPQPPTARPRAPTRSMAPLIRALALESGSRSRRGE